MKKLLLTLFVVFFGCLSVSLAYYPTSKDTENLTKLKTQLDMLIGTNNIDLYDFYNQIVNLQEDYSGNDRLNYMLEDLKYYLYSDTKNNKNSFNKQKTDAKTLSKQFKLDFLQEYNTGYSIAVSDSLKNCTGWYKTLDDLSFAYDLPTALTIAIWYRETSCAYFSPNNGDGPFQIKTMDYKTGAVTPREFVSMVSDFMEFSKNKINRYDGLLSGELSYSNFDMTGIVNFAALYNGGTRSGNQIIPNNPSYTFDGYGEDYSGAKRFGVVPQMIKVLEWELDNEY